MSKSLRHFCDHPPTIQKLMSTASVCIKNYGLRFNPAKPPGMIMGRNPFTTTPVWLIEDSPIKIENNIKYLGTDLGDLSGSKHCKSRVSATTRAFYLLQNAGIKYPNVNANAVIEIYRAAVQCISEFGCASIYIKEAKSHFGIFFI